MKKILFFVSLFAIVSCDDGDIIVTELDFEDQVLERCDDFDFLFYKINPMSNETIAFQFTTTEEILGKIDSVFIELDGNNSIVYRRFDDEVTDEYFCNPIPPTEPIVTDELISISGRVGIYTTGILEDNDGIPAEIEDPTGLLDTDGDGLLDIFDDDDDGDNIPTIAEAFLQNDENGNPDITTARNSDDDEIPDYLDPDDDNDSVLTINEDANGDLDPRNDESDDTTEDPDYLDSNFPPGGVALVTIEEYRVHRYNLVNVEIEIIVENVEFDDTEAEENLNIADDILNLGVFEAPDFPIEETPDFN